MVHITSYNYVYIVNIGFTATNIAGGNHLALLCQLGNLGAQTHGSPEVKLIPFLKAHLKVGTPHQNLRGQCFTVFSHFRPAATLHYAQPAVTACLFGPLLVPPAPWAIGAGIIYR